MSSPPSDPSKDAARWVLPSAIPFEHLKGHDLEECVYWLMDSLGAKDLEWRIGGIGAGTSDGGRDLEAWFFSPSPDGEMEGQRWWIECKGRSGTVEADTVKAACNNALAQDDLAYLVVVTNTGFSNPTRDWVKQWQKSHPHPRVKLWDKSSLERMLAQHPNAVFRLFSQALSTAGHLEVAREGFWNRFDYTSPRTLQTFWDAREDLAIGPLERIALVVSEFAHGRIGDRPWGVACEPQAMFQTLGLATANLPYLFGRALRGGIDQEPVIRGIAYLVLATLRVISAKDVAEMIEVCSADCKRVICGGGDAYAFDNEPIEAYWRRLDPQGRQAGPAKDDRQLWIEKNDAPCNVGFAVGPGNGCPLFASEPSETDLAELLAIVERVSDFRSAEAKAKATAGAAPGQP
ncbi:MAG: restriction endonuclease [Blastomonas fulva]|uniref:restriction endonuclease n=1 Tax=Blastomonas fulva TaxID=1550728 RepID=UPI0024E1E617|nr:restriction endonuclease [Blastomonas fulva]MDK2757605.1 restriction endonuclease [Blastomonas fulva]